MNKVILIDGGALTHRAIFQWNNAKKLAMQGYNIQVMPSHYTYFSMLICRASSRWLPIFSAIR